MPQKVVSLTFPANLQYSASVRAVADEVFGLAQFSRAWRSRLKLVMDELFMNAVNYGSQENQTRVWVEFVYDEQGIVFSVEDEGKGKKPVTAEELLNTLNHNSHDGDLTKTSGRGLSMIAQLWTDAMKIEAGTHGGLRITCSKKISAVEPPAPPIPVLNMILAPAEVVATPIQEGPMTELKLSGDLDQSQMNEKLDSVYKAVHSLESGAVLVLDLADVRYINSTFVGHLAEWHNQLKAKNAFLKLKHLPPSIQDVLDLVGLTRVVPVLS